EGGIEKMLHYMKWHRKVGILGPQLIYEDSTIQDSYRKFPGITDVVFKRTFLVKLPLSRKRLARYLMHGKNSEKTERVDWIVGAFLMIRKKALDQVGGFDPRFFLFFEDTDLCRRMGEKGWKVVYFPKAKATHHHQRLSGGSFSQALKKKTFRVHLASGMKYFWKYLGRRRP
ncbi:MAG TPA: hypothetical protein ENI70_01980, partial [Candidatus Peregrinibacteria bacterium]|nr:hypothetical protein [Candidatus Peregrinibacteria bacterium]